MKATRTICALLLACLLPSGASARNAVIDINDENFPDINFRNYLTSKDYGLDGKLTADEIVEVGAINVSGMNITSLQGIEFFSALAELNCSSNMLTDLDVSKNEELSKLVCSDNQLSELYTLKNINLTELRCDGNQLTSLDLSENNVLTILDCSNNQLKSLNVSDNIELRVLDCSNNQLTTLDLSGNATLTQVYCYNNQINAVGMEVLVNRLPDVTEAEIYAVDTMNNSEQNVCANIHVVAANAKGWTVYDYNNNAPHALEASDSEFDIIINAENFPDENFRNFLLRQDYGQDGLFTKEEIATVTAINVSSQNVASLQGIEFFTAITALDCTNNQLTALDVSNNTKLTTLKCYCNKIKKAQMEALIASMPEVENGNFYVYYKNEQEAEGGATFDDDQGDWIFGARGFSQGEITSNETILPTDYNEITKALAAIAASKGWTVWCHGYYESGNYGWYVYEVSGLLAINEKNFPDDNFRAYLLSQSYGKDGLFTEDEIAAVTTLNVSAMGIASLDGIELFTALTELRCNNNQLTSLVLSKNTKLTYVDCSNNLLTELDLSKNTSLVKLYCYGNQIKNTQMDELITNLPKIENGYFYVISSESTEKNIFTKLQATAAKAKGWTPYQYNHDSDSYSVYTGSATVTIINAITFPDDNFRDWLLKQEYGADGELSADEISFVTKMVIWGKDIVTLQGIEYFTALTELSCHTNQLASLDLSKNTELTYLDCGINLLTTLDMSKNTKLTTLNCYGNQLTTLDVSANTNLSSLDCSYNQLTTLDLSKNTALTTLYCYNNQIKDAQMDALIASLPTVEKGILYVMNDEPTEQNVCTRSQVGTAIAKGWNTYYYDNENAKWQEYEGINTDEEITVGNALVAGFSSFNSLDFTGSDVSAWIATGFRGGNVMLSRVDKVPAGTGVYLKAQEAGKFTVSATDDKAYYANFFVGTPAGLTVEPTETVGGETYQTLSFALSKTTGKPGFFPNTADKTYAAGKMYLHLPAWALADEAREDEGGEETETTDEGLVTVTVSEVGAAGFSSDKSVDFTGITGVSAWIATGFVDGNVLLSRVYAVPAGTGVYLKADNPGTAVTRNIPVTTEKACYANLFVGTGGTAITVKPTETIDGVTYRTLSFAKSKTTGKPGFFPNTDDKAYAAGKMYLRLPDELINMGSEARQMASEDATDDSRAFGLVFCETECLDGNGEMANGTTDIRSRMSDGMTDLRGVYDLQGRKVLNRKPMNKKSFIISGGRVHY